MTRHTVDLDVIAQAIALATRAPSVHNTQPWRWYMTDKGLDLYADDSVGLNAADPDGRELLVSCGAALHHVQIACAAAGWACEVERLPRLFQPNHLAHIRFEAHRPTANELSMAAAIPQRHTDRRPYDEHPIHAADLQAVLAAGTGADSVAHEVSPIEAVFLAAAQRAAARRHAGDPSYRLELSMWCGPGSTSEGVPPSNCVAPQENAPLPARVFVPGAAALPADESARRDHATLVVLATATNDRLAQLRAGEATSAIMLAATRLGLATCPVTEPLECPDIRVDIARELLGGEAFPQMILRVGYAPNGAVPVTPRRDLEDVLAAC